MDGLRADLEIITITAAQPGTGLALVLREVIYQWELTMKLVVHTLFAGLMLIGSSALAAKQTQAMRNSDPGLKSMKPAACHMRASLALDACTDASCMNGPSKKPQKAAGRDGIKKGG